MLLLLFADSGALFPAGYVLALAFAARYTVRTIRHDIVITMLARCLILIRFLPWVIGKSLLKIGAVPPFHARVCYKGIQPFRCRGVPAYIKSKGIQRLTEHLDLCFCSLLVGRTHMPKESGSYKRSEET